MTQLLDAVMRHAEARPDAIAIDGVEPVTWGTLARVLPPIAQDLATRFAGGRPVALQVDHCFPGR